MRDIRVAPNLDNILASVDQMPSTELRIDEVVVNTPSVVDGSRWKSWLGKLASARLELRLLRP